MTDKHRFASSSERWEGELWNVTLLPVERGRGAASPRQPSEGTNPLENLDERRRRDRESGASRLRAESESISASFEGQLKAVGW
jgi:hypothetical protein